MFRGLPTASLPLIQLFSSPYLFTVPSYQRPYSWTTKETGQLLEDISEAASIDQDEPIVPDYFLGTILLLDPEAEDTSPPPAFGGTRVFEVVDGQQRLATIAMLAAVLRDFEDRDGPIGGESVQLADRLDQMIRVERDARDLTLRQARLHMCASDQEGIEAHMLPRLPRTASAQHLAAHIAEVHTYLIGEIEALSREERRRLARYLMDCCHVVVIISRDIDRAHTFFKVLNDRGKPLERKDILKAEVLRTLPPAYAARGLELWDQAQSKLGPDFETFFSHLRLIRWRGRLPIIAGIRAIVSEGGSQAFLETSLTPMADALHRLRTFSGDPAIQRRPPLFAALTSLERMGKNDWVAPAMLAISHFDRSPEIATDLLLKIERLAFLLRLRGCGSDKRQRRFVSVIDAIKADPAAAATCAEFEITREEIRMIAFHLRDIHGRNATLAKLLLMRIEDALSGATLSLSPKNFSVEHILPLRPSSASSWRKLYADAAEREDCQASLGNLALISLKQNGLAENKDFAEKLAIYRSSEPNATPLLSNASILEASTWLSANIWTREADMLSVLSKLWRIEGLAPPAGGQHRAAGKGR